MSFSLKWILAVMAYVAIAATALRQHPGWLYADVLWCLSILSIVFAATLSVFARGQRKAAAIAFLLASIGFAGFRVASGFFLHGGLFLAENLFLMLGIDAVNPDFPDTVLRLRAANAIATLVFGLLGMLAGLLAFRAADCGEPDN